MSCTRSAVKDDVQCATLCTQQGLVLHSTHCSSPTAAFRVAHCSPLEVTVWVLLAGRQANVTLW